MERQNTRRASGNGCEFCCSDLFRRNGLYFSLGYNMARCIFENLTEEQAKTLAEYFEGQGEQDCVIWFDTHGVPSPMAQVRRKGEYSDKLENGDIIVYCHTP